MADQTLLTQPPESAVPMSALDDEEAPTLLLHKLETVSEPPIAAVSLDLQDNSPASPPVVVDEDKLKGAVTVVEKDAPLSAPLPEEPLAEDHVTYTVTAPSTEKEPAPRRVSQPLAAALAMPHESESPKIESEEVIEVEGVKPTDKKKAPESFPSFKEESNIISDLSNFEAKALEEFKVLVQESLNKGVFSEASPSEPTNLPEEVSIWGVPLLKDERTDVVLLKFLRARDFKVGDSFTMLKNTVKWRRDFNVDGLLIEDLGDDLEKVVFMHGHDKEGHPVCYNVYGEFQNKELYGKTFSDEEKRTRFLRWRIQFLERHIRKLDFTPGGVNTIFQVSDLKNLPGPGKRDLRIATRQALHVLQDNYPEFVAKQVFINVPWWYLAFYTMLSPFLTHRTKSKFVFAGLTRTAETLFKYVSPEQVPIHYGGLSVDFCECNPEFAINDPATEITIKPATKQTIEIIVNEKCTIVWELRVVGWDVSYSAEYVPNAEHGYTVMIQKTRKMFPTDEPVVTDHFNITELGKILLTVDNSTTRKKKLLYRFKVLP